jgi:hypothetical protein
MLDNDKLNRRLKKIFKELKVKWRVTPYRIAVETGIPHSSLKYMVDAKFEWKLNHLLAITDFLNRYGAKVSLSDLLDFNAKKSLAEIIKFESADFREVVFKKKIRHYDRYYNNFISKKADLKKSSPADLKAEAENLADEISDLVKESGIHNFKKVFVGLKITGKNLDFQKNMNITTGKR